MKKIKKINKNRIPKYSFGMFAAVSQMGTQIGDALQQNGNIELGSAISGAANPAMAGLKYLGNKDVSTGNKLLAFTGIGSVFAAKQARRAEEERQRNKRNNALGQLNTGAMEQEYWNENQLATTFANGGIIPNNPVYLDSGEITRDMTGNFNAVPNIGGYDDYLTSGTGLESVLSNRLKRKGTGNTYAEEMKAALKAPSYSKGFDRFAENTNTINEYNTVGSMQKYYNQLLSEQEAHKAKLGKTNKNGVPAYKDGFLRSLSAEEDPIAAPIITALNAPAIPKLDVPTPDPLAGTANLSSQIGVTPTPDAGVNAGSGFNFGNVLGTIGSLAPTMYNTFMSNRKAEQESPIQNPNSAAVSRILAQRRFNTRPVQEANRRSRAIANYNATNSNPNTGQNLALRTQMAVNEYAANADLYAQAQDANNKYAGEHANALSSLGQQYAQSMQYTNDVNAKNRAAQRNYGATAASQFGQWAQNQQLMSNQKGRDDMMFPLLQNYLSQGYGQDTIQQLAAKYYGRTV